MTKPNHKTIRFIVVGAVLYIAWLLLYQYYIKAYTFYDRELNYNIASLGSVVLDFFGISSYITFDNEHVYLLKTASDNAGVWVGDNCNGFKLFSIFSIFLIAFPGVWHSKLWYIPLGVLVVHFANVLRVAALFVISDHHPEWLDFNHLYTFTALVYIIIFLLWMFWIKKFGDKLNNEN